MDTITVIHPISALEILAYSLIKWDMLETKKIRISG